MLSAVYKEKERTVKLSFLSYKGVFAWAKQGNILLGAVAPTVIRAKRAEDILKGQLLQQKIIREASEVAAEEAKPISDPGSTAEYEKREA